MFGVSKHSKFQGWMMLVSTATGHQDTDFRTCLSRRAGMSWQPPPPTFGHVLPKTFRGCTDCSRQVSHIAGPSSRDMWDELQYDERAIMLLGTYQAELVYASVALSRKRQATS